MNRSYVIGSETMTDSRSDDSSSNTVVKVTPAELSHKSQTWLPVAARYVDAEDTVMFRSGTRCCLGWVVVVATVAEVG